MPVDKSKYPPDWKQISLAVREAADWRCEFCGAAHRLPHPETGSIVILTVAHLDHDTTNNERGNLRALCQRCHLTYDAQHHAANAKATRARKKREAAENAGQGELF